MRRSSVCLGNAFTVRWTPIQSRKLQVKRCGRMMAPLVRMELLALLMAGFRGPESPTNRSRAAVVNGSILTLL